MKPSVVTMAAAGCLVLWACSDDNSLSGSVSELFSLEVSSVTCHRNAEAFRVSYYRNRGREVDLVASVTVLTEGVTLEKGKTVSLGGEATPGHARTTVVHQAAGEPIRTFAEVKSGDLELEEGGVPGGVSEGNFSMSFKEGPDFGAGRTLEGTFRANTQDAGFGPEVGDPPN